ncbi:MAG: substrate-binding domain-containing protein [Oscillospiraceae bacterium]|nr:substrate-binding domain-containing protein [Oscillospiraceae bacterium]
MLTTKQQNKWICLITAVLLSFGAAGCSRFQSGEMPEESDDHVEETLPKETTPDETDQPVTSGYLTIPEISLSKAEALPYPEDTALFSAAPIGGEPVVYFFDNNLTFYIQTYLYSETEAAKEYYTGTLTLPDGITDGTVIYASRGGGSGEVDIIVKAVHENEQVYLDYYFNWNNENYLPGSVVVLDDLQVQHLIETIAFTENKSDNTTEKNFVTLPDNFIFPITDGSTSTTNLDKAIRNAILGGDQTVAHTKTYTSFRNLLDGKCELIFTTPLSASQLQDMEREGFRHEAEPVAGEGFVFVVNKDNPVDTLTVEQIKGIYSGEITNWKEVGGNDAEIIAYQRNADSGSQNYMISFMGDTPLMQPITEQTPASMSGILDVIAGYDNGIDAIGYSVYAYSDGMYENISEIKYIKVNGVEPSLTTLADGTYPLLGYNYAVFSADEPEDSNVRALVKWMQSDEGQQVIADAGYIPYRRVEGLTLPEPTTKMLYTAVGTSGVMKPDETADYYYQCNSVPDSFTAEGLDEAVAAFIADAEAELALLDMEEMQNFVRSRFPWGYASEDIVVRKTLINGYLSVVVGLWYNEGTQDSPDYYYDVHAAVFDIYTGERLELSDLFFEGLDFTAILNQYLANEAAASYSMMAHITHAMLHDFTGLYEGEFTFTADSIIFSRNTCFADGVVLSLNGLLDSMVTSVPRDMAGYADADTPVYMKIRSQYSGGIGYAEEKNGITIWYLDREKAPVSEEVCEKINGFIDNIYETYFIPEKLLAIVSNEGITAESVAVGPFPDFDTEIIGNRYILFRGANLGYASVSSEPYEFTVIDGHYNPYYFHYYFNALTGEELRIGDLFKDGWENEAEYSLYNESYNKWDEGSWTAYTEIVDASTCRILYIADYINAPYNMGDMSDLEIPVTVCVAAENGDRVVVSVPRVYVK